MAARTLLITGATGKQGGAVISALQKLSTPTPFNILALTRNASSPSASHLASQPNITIVEGAIETPAPIFATHKSIYGVFCISNVGKNEVEETKPLIDESIKNGVNHFIFTSVERGGPEVSHRRPTYVHHFATKHEIEEYLKTQVAASGSKMQWTILRPVAFMDNLTPDFYGKGFAAMWKALDPKPLQLVCVKDIGVFAARAFNEPEKYHGRAISLAGDELTLEQGKKVFKEVLGYDMPESFGFVGTGLKMVSKELGTMFKWFGEYGFGADIEALRREEPTLRDLKIWLREDSKFEKR